MKKFLLVLFVLAVAGCSTPTAQTIPARAATPVMKAKVPPKSGSILWSDRNKPLKK